MNITTEHNNEISETKRMSKADKELLTIDWRKSGQRIVIFRFKILQEKTAEYLIRQFIRLISRKEDGRNCHYGRNINRCRDRY